MNTTMLSGFPKHFTTISIPLSSNSRHRHLQPLLRFPIKSSSDSSDSATSNDDDNASQPVVPPNNVKVQFRRRTRRSKQQEALYGGVKAAKPKPPPKDWEDMTLQEKAIELYVGEKGALFWLNKFAYASIYIIIGGWILFRFVGPALNLYQLDSTPLPPSAMFKGS